ncbi:MAG: hypothetical protein ABEI39_01185 [Halobacteriales archaeon]
MRNLRRLESADLLTIGAGIAAGNGLTLLAAAALGLSDVPAGLLEALASFLLVAVGFSVLPALAVVVLAYVSFTYY